MEITATAQSEGEGETLAKSSCSGNSAIVADLYQKLSLRNIPALDGLRAIAIVLVLFYHLGVPPGVPGPMGVTLFFVLSGFLITWLLIKEFDKSGAISLRQFYKRRLLRIFPAFYSYWFFSVAVLYFAGRAIPWREFMSSFFYFSNYYYSFARPARPFMPFTWSLAVEEQFYLIWPFVFVVCVSNLRRLTAVLCGIILAVWVYRLIAFFVFHADFQYLQHSFETRIDHLMIGALLAVLLRRQMVSSYVGAVCRSALFPGITVAILAASVGLEHLITRFDYRHTIGYVVEPIAIATFLIQMVSLGGTPFWKWINWAPTRLLGRWSYSLYLYHFSATRLVKYLMPDTMFKWRWQLCSEVLAALLLACGSYYLIEMPFLKLKARKSPVSAASRLAESGTSGDTCAALATPLHVQVPQVTEH